jgi:hypothetical protein
VGLAPLALALVEKRVSVDTHRINIIDNATLREAADLIRDGEFADDDFHFDSSQQSAILSLWKSDESLSSFEAGGLLARYHVSPMRRFVLTFRSVANVEFLRQSSGAGNHPIGGIRWDHRHTVCIDTYDGITIQLTVATLDGSLEITDDVDRNRNQRRLVCLFFTRMSNNPIASGGGP